MDIMTDQTPDPQPPLYTCTPACFTCGKIISHLWFQYKKDMKQITSNAYATMPIRTIDIQKKTLKHVKSEEGKLLDSYGVIKYCCRRMIITHPMNTTPIQY